MSNADMSNASIKTHKAWRESSGLLNYLIYKAIMPKHIRYSLHRMLIFLYSI